MNANISKKRRLLNIALKKIQKPLYGGDTIYATCRPDEYLMILKYFAIKLPNDYQTLNAISCVKYGNQKQYCYSIRLTRKKYNEFFNAD